MILLDQLRGRRRAAWIYNAPIRAMLLRSTAARRAGFAVLFLLFPGIVQAADWHQSEVELAQRIAAVTGPGVVALELDNRSRIGPKDVEEIRRGLVLSLAGAGVRVWQAEQSASEVAVTLSENLTDYVWVAEIRQGATDKAVVIVSTPRPDEARTAPVATPLSLHATRLVSRSRPILDAAFVEGTPRMLVALGPGEVTVYEFKDGRWIEDQSLPIRSPHPLPRDRRGRLVLRKDHLFDAYLPGLFCRSTGPPLGLDCAEKDDPWPLEQDLSGFFAPQRNFFTGALVPGIGQQKSGPAFYSAAPVRRERYTLWILAGIDGRLHLVDGLSHQVATKVRWGSNLAGVHAACRQGSVVLATSEASEGSDWLQAFEFPDREPVAVSQRLELSGSVTSLWTTENGESAVAVVDDAENGDYEAVLVSLDCNR